MNNSRFDLFDKGWCKDEKRYEFCPEPLEEESKKLSS